MYNVHEVGTTLFAAAQRMKHRGLSNLGEKFLPRDMTVYTWPIPG